MAAFWFLPALAVWLGGVYRLGLIGGKGLGRGLFGPVPPVNLLLRPVSLPLRWLLRRAGKR